MLAYCKNSVGGFIEGESYDIDISKTKKDFIDMCVTLALMMMDLLMDLKIFFGIIFGQKVNMKYL